MPTLTINIMDIVTFDTLYILDANNFSECYETKAGIVLFTFSSFNFIIRIYLTRHVYFGTCTLRRRHDRSSLNDGTIGNTCKISQIS